MRKINLFALILLPLFTLPVEAGAFDFTCDMDSENRLRCSVSVIPFRTESLLDSMELGHRAEIIYTIRVYEDRARILGLFGGDRLVKDVSETYIATWDPIQDIYIITDSDGKRVRQDSSFSFFNTFFRADDIIINMKKEGKGNYYVKGRIEMKVIKLMPPLNLLSGIIPGVLEKSEWETVGRFRIK